MGTFIGVANNGIQMQVHKAMLLARHGSPSRLRTMLVIGRVAESPKPHPDRG
jgi:hypothetical protein